MGWDKLVEDEFDPEDWLKLSPATRARRCRLLAMRARESALSALWPDDKERYGLIAAAWDQLARLMEPG
jgi:hypothetical protein